MAKNLFSVFLFLLAASGCMAEDEYAVGVYITKSNDTLLCKVLIPKDFGKFNEPSLFSKVTLLDSTGNKKKFNPGDINGYAFFYHSKKYIYVSRQVEDNGKRMFLWPLELGKKINEYYYYTYNSDNLNKGSMGAINEVYVIEDTETKETVSVARGGSLTENYKSQLRRFFENDKKVLALLAQDVKNFHDINKFVKDANKE